MRFVIQRVLSASVSVDSKVISSIGKGVCVLVGIHRDDTIQDGKRLISKLMGMRLWPDKEERPWKTSLVDNHFEILFVSQFTLYARMKGTKPDYSHAMTPEDARKLYDNFLALARSKYDSEKIFDGQFGAYMKVQIENDGPVTITLNTDDSVAKQKKDPNSHKSQKKKEKTNGKPMKSKDNGQGQVQPSSSKKATQSNRTNQGSLLQRMDKVIDFLDDSQQKD